MNRKLLLCFGLILFLAPALAGCLGPSEGPGGQTDYTLEPKSGDLETSTGYAEDGGAGQSFSFSVPDMAVTEVSFTLTWTDDHPQDTQDEFTLTVSGTTLLNWMNDILNGTMAHVAP